jgi:hypothetical protein
VALLQDADAMLIGTRRQNVKLGIAAPDVAETQLREELGRVHRLQRRRNPSWDRDPSAMRLGLRAHYLQIAIVCHGQSISPLT